uniref:Reverse transcriptase domain-containing protein n=1 Tax=Steinernema glaseri TaxID=37863 RepID=A0A1I8AS85_9BILA
MATTSSFFTNWLSLAGCNIVQQEGGDIYYEAKQFPASSAGPSLTSWLLRAVWCQPSASVHRSTYQVPQYSLSFQADIFWGAPCVRKELAPLFAKLRNDVRAAFVPSETDSPMAVFVSSAEHLAALFEELWRRQKVPDEWTDLKHCILMHNFGFNLLERVLIRRLALYGLYLINANDGVKRRTPINAVCAARLKMTTNPGGHHMAMIARLSDLGVPVGFVTIVRSFFKTVAPEKDPPQLSAFLFDWAVELLMTKSGVPASARWQIDSRDYVVVADNADELRVAVEGLRRHSADYGVRISPGQSLVVRKRGLPRVNIEELREVEGFDRLSEFVGSQRDAVLQLPPLLGLHDFWGPSEASFESCGALPRNVDIFLAVGWFDVLVGRLRPFGYEDAKTELRILISSVKLTEEDGEQEKK